MNKDKIIDGFNKFWEMPFWDKPLGKLCAVVLRFFIILIFGLFLISIYSFIWGRF